MRVSTAEFISRFDDLSDRADTEAVTITEDGHDKLVLVSAGEYACLKRHDGDGGAPSEQETADGSASPAGGTPDLWGALKHTIVYISDDIAEPTGEVWDAER